MTLEATGLLTQDSDTGGTTLLDACNGFNEMSRLLMLWTVRHHWLTGARFLFNCYRHWEKLLLRQPGVAPVILLRQEGVSQGEPLLIQPRPPGGEAQVCRYVSSDILLLQRCGL